MTTVPSKSDGRREVGDRTCQRLLDATLTLLAEHGEDGVTLREITDAADANVAAVSYHFGSKTALIKRALDHAIDQVLDAQEADLQALGEEPAPEGIARALARPAIDAVANGGRDLAVFRIIVRATIDPPLGCRERLSGKVARRRTQLAAALRPALPELDDAELAFRSECVIGLLDRLILGAGEALVEGKTRDELEQLLVPMLVGALTGGTALAPRS